MTRITCSRVNGRLGGDLHGFKTIHRNSPSFWLAIFLVAGCSSSAFSADLSQPEKNFEALWKTFHERYAFFELRGVDWQAQYKTYRPMVTKDFSRTREIGYLLITEFEGC